MALAFWVLGVRSTLPWYFCRQAGRYSGMRLMVHHQSSFSRPVHPLLGYHHCCGPFHVLRVLDYQPLVFLLPTPLSASRASRRSGPGVTRPQVGQAQLWLQSSATFPSHHLGAFRREPRELYRLFSRPDYCGQGDWPCRGASAFSAATCFKPPFSGERLPYDRPITRLHPGFPAPDTRPKPGASLNIYRRSRTSLWKRSPWRNFSGFHAYPRPR